MNKNKTAPKVKVQGEKGKTIIGQDGIIESDSEDERVARDKKRKAQSGNDSPVQEKKVVVKKHASKA
jgi:hypothetical protein